MQALRKLLFSFLFVISINFLSSDFSAFSLVFAEDNQADENSLTEENDTQHNPFQTLKEGLKELATGTSTKSGTYNLLLIGVDRRDDTWNGNSDAMILVTINYDRDTIYLTSFMRDLYADIPWVGVRKLNNAFAVGGAELCVETLKSNYDVQIDHYVWVDFNGMISIIDAIGGIDIEVPEEEISVINGYIKEMASLNNVDPESHYLTYAGLVHMDGYMATAYSRNRYSGGSNDFGRTERQRNVLNAILKKVKSGDLGSYDFLSNLVLDLSSFITHDLDPVTFIKLVSEVPSLLNFQVEQLHVPFDDSYYRSNEILIPNDMTETINRIKSIIY